MNRSRTILLALAGAAFAAMAVAQQPQAGAGADHAAHHPAPAASAAAEMAEGEVRRVDKPAGKLTLRHGELKALDMPAMTMVFTVRDAALLEGLQPGDKVRFRAAKDGSVYIVTALEPVR